MAVSRLLPVRLAELAAAFDRPRSDLTRSYFDRQTGEVEHVPFELQDESVFADVLSAPARFLSVPPASPVARYRLRADFLDEVKDPQLRLQLADALDRPRGALAEFERVLRRWPEARDAWLAFRDRALDRAVRAWLATLDIVPVDETG